MLLSVILLGEIALVVYIFLQQEAVSYARSLVCFCQFSVYMIIIMLQAFDTLRTLFVEGITNYFDDVNLRNLIDFIQADVSVFFGGGEVAGSLLAQL